MPGRARPSFPVSFQLWADTWQLLMSVVCSCFIDPFFFQAAFILDTYDPTKSNSGRLHKRLSERWMDGGHANLIWIFKMFSASWPSSHGCIVATMMFSSPWRDRYKDRGPKHQRHCLPPPCSCDTNHKYYLLHRFCVLCTCRWMHGRIWRMSGNTNSSAPTASVFQGDGVSVGGMQRGQRTRPTLLGHLLCHSWMHCARIVRLLV